METISFACKLFLSLSSFIFSCWKSFCLEIVSFSKGWRETIRKVCWKLLCDQHQWPQVCPRRIFVELCVRWGTQWMDPVALVRMASKDWRLGSPTYLASTPSGKRDCRSPASYPFHSVHPFHTISPISSIFILVLPEGSLTYLASTSLASQTASLPQWHSSAAVKESKWRSHWLQARSYFHRHWWLFAADFCRNIHCGTEVIFVKMFTIINFGQLYLTRKA